ncbi:MAG: tyrosine-type recombinase/integrase [Alphaproteobacteria bacterium]
MRPPKFRNLNRTKGRRLADGTRREYLYHRVTRIRLPDDENSPKFAKAWAEAETSTSRLTAGTLAALLHKFSRSPEFAQLRDTTRRDLARLHRRIEEKFGDMPFIVLEDRRTRPKLLDWRDKIAATAPRSADAHMTALASVLSWAVERGELKANVLTNYRRVYKSTRANVIWLPEHIEAFNAVASPEMRTALMLALHTGQRQGDLLRLTWAAYDGQRIWLRQGKGGVRVDFPATLALKAMLDGMERRNALILTTPTGRPWSKRYFSQAWQQARDKAKITWIGDDGETRALHFHDLRGTAVTMLAEAGCTIPEIAAITGHSFAHANKVIEIYLHRTRHLADRAIDKLNRHIS